MRVNAVLATALYSSAALLGQVRADDTDDSLESSTPVVEETSTTSAIEKPTFTVRNLPFPAKNNAIGAGSILVEARAKYHYHSPPNSKQIFLNSLRMTGKHAGNHLTRKKRIQRLLKNGHMLANGRLRNPMFSRPLRETRAWL